MKVSATQKHARMSPRKLRPYARMIQGMKVVSAQQQLSFAAGKAPVIILDVLKSAIANATHNLQIPVGELRVASIVVNQGLVMKRFMPVSKGMAHPILKRTAHVTVIVEGQSPQGVKSKKAKKKQTIETVSASEFVALEEKSTLRQAQGKERELAHEHLEKHASDDRPVEKTTDKKSGVFTKIKTNQQGSDAKKTHRRKSIG